MFETLIVDAAGPIGSITLNRPNRLNALSRLTLVELTQAAKWFDDQAHVKVVIVKANGRAFSAGFDLNDFTTPDPDVSPRDAADLGRLMAEAVTNMRAMTIARIHGHCVGGGLVLAGACDLRYATADATFSIPELALGIPLAWGGIPRLVRELGPAVTKDIVMTCRPFTCHEALALRFINGVGTPENIDHQIANAANALGQRSKLTLELTKRQINACAEELVSVGRSVSDADTLVAAQRDPESRAASLAYLASRNRQSGQRSGK